MHAFRPTKLDLALQDDPVARAAHARLMAAALMDVWKSDQPSPQQMAMSATQDANASLNRAA